MALKEDDTLPLPALSQEFSVDVTADEDFIPTSQPLRNGCTKVSKTSEVSFNTSANEPNPTSTDDTLPPEAVIDRTTYDKDKSSDFIPDTETKKFRLSYVKDEPLCRKKLPVFHTHSICPAQSSPMWETQVAQIPESPALDTQNFSVLRDSLVEVQALEQETSTLCDKSVAEIIVNDSAETVDLEGSPIKGIKSESETKTEKLSINSISCSINSDVGRCEETQIFDNSSVLLLDQPGALTADQSENSTNETTSAQNLYLMKTVEENESSLREQENLVVSECSPAVAETSRNFLVKDEFVDVARPKENAVPKEETEATPEERTAVVTRKIDFQLTVTCFVTFNAKTNRIMQKFISKVNETPKSQPKPFQFEHLSDNASDKSKRYSTSSSGSVYSDKHGFPFALSKRVSVVSDQTDSSEDDFGARMKDKGKALGRTPWSNEYLLPLKLDELMQASIESQQIPERSSTASSLKEPYSRRSRGVSRLKGTVQSSSSEARSVGISSVGGSQSLAVTSPANDRKESPEDVDKAKGNHGDGSRDGEVADEKREKTVRSEVEGSADAEVEEQKERAPPGEAKEVAREEEEEGRCLGVLGEGLPVLARWTDKRYYSGVLCGSPKNERWDVKFDDGTSKTVREDLIMPSEWLRVGALVFALVDDQYESGQIVDIERGKEVTYLIELDSKKKKVSAKASDLSLTDVMASIIREKYKPLAGTPRGKADIDFDNVLSGKRLREQRTPARTIVVAQLRSSEPKKKSSKKVSSGCALGIIKETPEVRGIGKRVAGLKSESGHLVEDKVASGDSPSGNEAVEGTPLRRASKEAKGKAKPRTLSYEAEDSRSGRGKVKNWLTVDGTPIPGPSGVKMKRKTSKPKEEDSNEPSRKRSELMRSVRSRPEKSVTPPEWAEKGKRKRRLEGLVEENVNKKLLRRGDVGTKTKSKKG